MWFMDVKDRNNMPICTKNYLWMWGWDVIFQSSGWSYPFSIISKLKFYIQSMKTFSYITYEQKYVKYSEICFHIMKEVSTFSKSSMFDFH